MAKIERAAQERQAADDILYIQMKGNYAEVHLTDGEVYAERTTMRELEQRLGSDFIKVHRSCLVAARAIYDIADQIVLNNGKTLDYTVRKKKQIEDRLNEWQKHTIGSFRSAGTPDTPEEYARYYQSMENLPFAFTDIEMIFDEQKRAVDWIFRYGNPALARVEKLPLEQLIGATFGSLFANMDAKWLRAYERAVLYHETLEIVDYSPEVDTDLKIICFPTFPGHCGCMLFDLSRLRFVSGDSMRMLGYFLGQKSLGA